MVADGDEGTPLPPETKKPKTDSVDFLGKMFGVDPAEMDKAILAQQLDGTLDRTLKLLQIVYYSKSVFGVEEAEKLAKHYRAGIEVLAENADEAVKLFQKKHGEL